MIYVLMDENKSYYAGIEYKQIRNTEDVNEAAKFSYIEADARTKYLERMYDIKYEVTQVPEVSE